MPIEHGFAVGVTRHDLVNATAVSDTAAAMFLSMARIHYLSEEEISNLNSVSIERGVVGASGFDNISVGPASIAQPQQSTTSMVQFHPTGAVPQPLTTVSSPNTAAPRAPNVDASGSDNTASSSSSGNDDEQPHLLTKMIVLAAPTLFRARKRQPRATKTLAKTEI